MNIQLNVNSYAFDFFLFQLWIKQNMRTRCSPADAQSKHTQQPTTRHCTQELIPNTVCLTSLDFGRMIFLRLLLQLENSLARFLSETFPTQFCEALSRKNSGWNKQLDLNELLNFWEEKTVEIAWLFPEVVQRRKIYLKLKSFVSIARKRRNEFSHGKNFSPTLLTSFILASGKLQRAFTAGNFVHFVVGKQLISSELKDQWSTKQWHVPFSESSQTAHSVSRLLRCTAKTLIGREQLLADLFNQITHSLTNQGFSRLLLHGPRGVGKTATVRQLAKQLCGHCDQQYSFQANSSEALLTDIELFLSSHGCDHVDSDTLRSFLDTSQQLFLLIFEDVIDPSSVLPLIPAGRHCIIFTAASDIMWAKGNFLREGFMPVKVPSLSTNDSVHILNDVLAQCRKLNDFQCGMHGLFKQKVLQTLKEQSGNIPLAVRLYAFQLAQQTARNQMFLLNPQTTGLGRSELDEKAAGCVHVVGFHNLVRSALKALPGACKAKTRQLCFAFSLLPPNGVEDWFLELLGTEIGMSLSHTDEALSVLLTYGLINRDFAGQNSKGCSRFAQPCMVQEHAKKIMLETEESLAYTTAQQIVKALEAKLSCLWRNENEEMTQQESSTETWGRADKNGGYQRRSLCFEECLHMVDIITTVLDLADELQIQGKDVFNSFIGCFFLLKVYCKGPWWLPDDIENQKKYHHQLIDSALMVSCGRFCPSDLAAWSSLDSKDVFRTTAFLLNESLCERKHEDFETHLSPAMVLANKSSWFDFLSRCLYSFQAIADYLLCQYEKSGKFSSLCAILLLCEMLNLYETKLPIVDRFLRKILTGWLKVGQQNDPDLWWQSSYITTAVNRLIKVWYRVANIPAALYWCDIAFTIALESSIQPQFIFVSTKVAFIALKCCTLKPNHADFFKWFCRLLELKTTLSFLPQGVERHAFEAFSLAYVYVNRYVENNRDILLGIACNLQKLLEAKASRLVSYLGKKRPAYPSVRSALFLNVFFGLCLRDFRRTQTLMKMGAMQLCHHHDRRVAKNRKLGFRGHVRSTKFDVDWERRCFALVVSSFDKHSLLSLILIIGNICLPVVLHSFERR